MTTQIKAASLLLSDIDTAFAVKQMAPFMEQVLIQTQVRDTQGDRQATV